MTATELTPIPGRSKNPSALRRFGDVIHVSLTADFYAVIDAQDEASVSGYRWVLMTTKSGHAYACRRERLKAFLMHREILQAPKDRQVDHEDGDGLNNRRSNIRLATPTQNQANKVAERRNRLGLKGVSKDARPRKKPYRASIKPEGKSIHLGYFETPEEAAAAYKGAAIVLWGEFAKK